MFNEQARLFNQNKTYCDASFKSKDFVKYWNFEKEKCTKGAIYTSGKSTWYVPRDYYMWLNFLPIYDKEEGTFGFAKIRDAQYHLALYELRAELHFKHCPILKKRQIAQQPHSEPILGEYGWITMGEVKIGDKLWNPDGTLTTVTDKSDNGVSDVYEFELMDGRITRCGIEHNWEVYDRDAKKVKVLNIRQLMEKGLLSTPITVNGKIYKNYRYCIRNTKPLDFKGEDPVTDGYLIGVILGDGSCGGSNIAFTTNDNFIRDSITEIVGNEYEVNPHHTKANTTALRYGISYKKRHSVGFSPLIREFRDMGLMGQTTHTKRIPEQYLKCSTKCRIALLQGLMDTDGYVNSHGLDIHYTSANKLLCEDVVYLCRSLGIKAKIFETLIENAVYYRARLSGNIQLPIFRLPRKLERFNKRKEGKKTHELNPIVSIKKLTYQERSSCIVVDNPNHLYITKDFIVTHNSSYYHMGKLLNAFWFENGAVLKTGASREDYINLKGSWRFLTEYRDFLNKHTAWYRACTPDKVLNWQQRIETTTADGRKSHKGNKSLFTGTSFEKDPSAGVGGPCTYFFHEEGGIAPKADKTFFFMKPAMQSGHITTGVFIIAGSVGELEKCEPLKDMIMRPGSDFMSVTHNLMDENWAEGTTGLFIPEQWSMPPYIDRYGNSVILDPTPQQAEDIKIEWERLGYDMDLFDPERGALQAIMEQREVWKKEYSPEKYQYEVSQHPINIKEAFDFRTESVFPVHLVQKQIAAIEAKEVYEEYLDLVPDRTGAYQFQESRRFPLKFPTEKKLEDKRGCIIVHERPPVDPDWGMYYGSIDPVGEGKTTTSESLFCIQIYKAPIERTIHSIEGSKTVIEGDKLVASWTGRYDDINDTHELALALIEKYNAWTLIEANVSLFVQYMIHKNKQKYMVPKDQIVFLSDLKSNQNVYSAYGWKNTGTIFKAHLISYAIEYCKEIIDQELMPDGGVLRTHYGIERIPDRWLLEEMLQYRDGMNADRLVAFAALVAFRALQLSNRGYKKIVEYKENFPNSKNLYNLKVPPFNNIGQHRISEVPPEYRMNRRGFKNIR